MDVTPADERADALRAAKLVRRDAEEVRAKGGHVAIDASGALHGVDMKDAAGFVDDFGDLGDRLDDAGLVIGEHHRDERVLGPRKCASKSIKIKQTPIGYFQFLDRRGQKTPTAAHRRMLD